ncbi:hypothetical protein PanWU01x14_187780 [Parasponia andersonii]|uniref:Uncharacterized protein n=1 Tax=Parasponia andersonii TaxID=3476 RepID=A0A2P5C312_PARAD|nr:hypothetical protein PanWU01x14_187780 [Parasponia andersonii]
MISDATSSIIYKNSLVYEQLDTGEVDVFTKGVSYPPVLHIKKATLAKLIVMHRAQVAKSGVKKKE